MIATAKQRADGCGLPVEFQTGDAHQLAFADNIFDASRADRIFMHLDSPAQALREMMRVTRPGGRVLVYEVDFETLTVDMPDRSTSSERSSMSGATAFAMAGSAAIFPALFHDAGLQEVRITPATLWLRYPVAMQMVGPGTVERACAAGVLSQAEGEAWLRELREIHEAGRLFCTLTGFIVVGLVVK